MYIYQRLYYAVFCDPSPRVKIVLLGACGVGKSTLLRQYSHKIFDDTVKSTIGVDLETKRVQLPSNTHVVLQIWDTAGQEAYHSITRNYYKKMPPEP